MKVDSETQVRLKIMRKLYWEALGSYLKTKRKENAKLSQAEVGKKLKYKGPAIISRIEKGMQPPSLSMLSKLAREYKIPKTELINFINKWQRTELKEIL